MSHAGRISYGNKEVENIYYMDSQCSRSVSSLGPIPHSVVPFSVVTLVFAARVPLMWEGRGALGRLGTVTVFDFLASSGSEPSLGNTSEALC